MINRMLMAVMASTAIAYAPAFAAPGGAHGAPATHGSAGASGASGASMGGGPAGAALDARLSSMGSANASTTGVANANANSALSTSTTPNTHANSAAAMNGMFPNTKTTTAVESGSLSGLTTGMTLTSNGTTVGTVQQIRTTGNGSVAVVIVKGTNGQMFAIPANKLTLANGILTTTARLNGVNGGTAAGNAALAVSQGPLHASTTGIAHASSNSVLAGGEVASSALPGLTTGLTVQSAAGTNLGTVSDVVMGPNGTIRAVVVTSPTGATFRLEPTTLSMSGSTVITGIGG